MKFQIEPCPSRETPLCQTLTYHQGVRIQLCHRVGACVGRLSGASTLAWLGSHVSPRLFPRFPCYPSHAIFCLIPILSLVLFPCSPCLIPSFPRSPLFCSIFSLVSFPCSPLSHSHAPLVSCPCSPCLIPMLPLSHSHAPLVSFHILLAPPNENESNYHINMLSVVSHQPLP